MMTRTFPVATDMVIRHEAVTRYFSLI